MEKKPKRQYRRDRRFVRSVSVSLSPETTAAIESLSDKYGLAKGVILRKCIENGLPRVKDGMRKQAKEQTKA